ncbi:MAG TPA: hypothetical protein VGR67_07215 [Candidatus Polarisedimenticolia bacterium]|nr:hypothetical protein [Candidatus Polarisedimenticolia bacterium]
MSECAQPVAPQESAVHALASSQLTGVPLWHVPLLQTSPAVHAFPSLQGVVLLGKEQLPVAGSQRLSVQGLLSKHFVGEPGLQNERTHSSKIVHGFPSHSLNPPEVRFWQPPEQKPPVKLQPLQTQCAQALSGGQRLLSGKLMQPVLGEHVSRVQNLSSLQGLGVPGVQFPELQESDNVHGFPSLQPPVT